MTEEDYRREVSKLFSQCWLEGFALGVAVCGLTVFLTSILCQLLR